MIAVNRRMVLGLLTAVLLVSAAACADTPTVGAGPGSVALPSSPTQLPTFAPAQFRELLGRLEGTPVVVNIWASWCGPCVTEAPHLAQAARDYEGRIRFIGVDIQDQRSTARSFVRRFGWPYPSVFDPTGAIRDDLGLIGQPNTVLYDRTGAQVYVATGAITLDVLRPELDKLVAETSSPAGGYGY
jgi:thiol-disulfide isomerase/thioredoxin